MKTYLKHYVMNFGWMFAACLLVDLTSYLTNKTSNVLSSVIISLICAGVFTYFKYLRDK